MKHRGIQILNESKRDDLLQRFVILLNNNGITVDIGTVKSRLLNKFVTEGNIHNLSLRSNYYLAGVARYYFDGVLTKNKDLSVLKKEYWEGSDVHDIWDVNVCKKIDALILVLRNAYIDTIGQTMLEPEDFGELPIRDLFEKYKKEIKKVVGTKPRKKQGDEIDTSDSVGNGYTFEIIYSQDDCTKYNQATSPGAWCITFSQTNYDYYIRHYNIHYVIFKQNGYEKIPRPTNPLNEPGFTRDKPQDAYGNSLIALLQSNNSPEPMLITSRWNHGHEVSCEADHAYTTDEFKKVTGVTDEDLERIFKIWKMNYKNGKKIKTDKKEELFVLRSLKYLQMRINAGENPEKLFDTVNHIHGNTKINKGCFACSAKISETTMGLNEKTVYFLYDNGKIIFESVGPHISIYQQVKDLFVVINFNKDKHLIYSLQKHKPVSVDNNCFFRRIPSVGRFQNDADNIAFFEVKKGKLDGALIDVSTMEPIRLPNGEYYYGIVTSNGPQWGYWHNDTEIYCKIFKKSDNLKFQFIYDISSLENYFYDAKTKQFTTLETPQDIILRGDTENRYNLSKFIPTFYDIDQTSISNEISIIRYVLPSERSLANGRISSYYSTTSKLCILKNGKRISVNGNQWFSDFDVISFKSNGGNQICGLSVDNNNQIIATLDLKQILSMDGKNAFEVSSHYDVLKELNVIGFYLRNTDGILFLFIDAKNNGCYFLCNPFSKEHGDLVFRHVYTDIEYQNSGYVNLLKFRSNFNDNDIPEQMRQLCVRRYDEYNYIKFSDMMQFCELTPCKWISTGNEQETIQINENDIYYMVTNAVRILLENRRLF